MKLYGVKRTQDTTPLGCKYDGDVLSLTTDIGWGIWVTNTLKTAVEVSDGNVDREDSTVSKPYNPHDNCVVIEVTLERWNPPVGTNRGGTQNEQ